MSTAPTNPLLQGWTTPFEAPPFGAIRTEHFREAIDAGLAEHRAEIEAIANHPEAPSFGNTIRALEIAGRTLDKVSSVFFNLTGANTSDELQAIERDVAPLFARHRNAIYLDDGLFRRVDALFWERSSLGLDAEEARVLERYHLAFTRSGAGRPEPVKRRLAAIGERLATLGTTFGQNVLADEAAWVLPLDEAAGDLDGL